MYLNKYYKKIILSISVLFLLYPNISYGEEKYYLERFPEKPISDEEYGDIVKFEIKNKNNEISYEYAEWVIELGVNNESEEYDWIDITNRINEKGNIKNFNNSNFYFKLNLENDLIMNLGDNIVMRVSAILFNNSNEVDNIYNIFKVFKLKDSLFIYNIKDGFNKKSKICSFFKGEYNSCEILENHLFEIDSFQHDIQGDIYWELNGSKYECLENGNTECKGNNIFLNTKDSSDKYITLKRLENGIVNKISGQLIVIKPFLNINITGDSSGEINNGHLEIYRDDDIELSMDIKPKWLDDEVSYVWKVNGREYNGRTFIINTEDDIDRYVVEPRVIIEKEDVIEGDKVIIRVIENDNNGGDYMLSVFSKLPRKGIIILEIVFGLFIIFFIFKFIFPLVYYFISKK